MYRTILFDFDGTIVSSLELWLEGFRHAFSELGRDVPDSTIIERCFYRDGESLIAEFELECSKTFWGLVEARLTGLTPVMFPGVREVLDHCSKQNIPLGLVTSSEQEFVRRAFKELQIGKYFDVMVTANDITNFKPHPEPVLQALKRLNAKPEETLFVGDHMVDVIAGKAAGTATAVFYTEEHSRFHDYDAVKGAGPDFIFSDYRELLVKLTALSEPVAG